MASIPLSTIATAIGSIRAHFERRQVIDDATGHELRHVLKQLSIATPTAAFEPPASNHGVTRHITSALRQKPGQVIDVLDAFRPLFPSLPWRYGYASRNDTPGLEHNMGWAELVGPVAPFQSDSVCLGFTLIGPNILYPLHRHPAVEVYFVLSGKATWTAAQQSGRRAPGEYILHTRNVPHAMQTGAESLLAVYTWSGDVHTSSVYSDLSSEQ